MTQKKDNKIKLMFCFFSFILSIVTPISAQHGASNGDWPYWGGDAGSTRYSALDQINKDNVKNLEIAWRWYSANYGPIPEFYFRATPLEVGGVLYTVAGERRAAVAIDAGTGETLWVWRMKKGERCFFQSKQKRIMENWPSPAYRSMMRMLTTTLRSKCEKALNEAKLLQQIYWSVPVAAATMDTYEDFKPRESI